MNVKAFVEKRKWAILISFCLFLNLAIATTVRVRNLPLSEGKYLLETDAYRFLRQAKIIVEQGKLPERDMMRYVPLGRDLTRHLNFSAYAIAFLYKSLKVFLPTLTIEQTAIFYPILCFLASLIVFFFLVRLLFNSIVATLATTMLAGSYPMFFRTMAGFADRDGLSLLFILGSFYFYIASQQNHRLRNKLLLSFVSGVVMTLLGLTWEGVGLFIAVIVLCEWVPLLLDKLDPTRLYRLACWVMPQVIGLLTFTRLYHDFSSPITFLTLVIPILLMLLALIASTVKKSSTLVRFFTLASRISLGFSLSLGLTGLGIGSAFLMLGHETVLKMFTGFVERFLHPVGNNRLMWTVSELKPPYLAVWWEWYGLTAFLILAGAFLSIKRLADSLKLPSKIGMASLGILVAGTLLSLSSANSVLNGETLVSQLIYIGSLLLAALLVLVATVYSYWRSASEANQARTIEAKHLFLWVWSALTFFCARGGLRFSFFFTPAAVVLGSYAISEFCRALTKGKDEGILIGSLVLSLLCWEIQFLQDNLLTFLIRIFSFSALKVSLPTLVNYNLAIALALLFVGVGIRTLMRQQSGSIGLLVSKAHTIMKSGVWSLLVLFVLSTMSGIPKHPGQLYKSYIGARLLGDPMGGSELLKALEWMKDKLPLNAVVAAPWDYGSMINVLSEKATIVDEDHFIPYWIHLMARKVWCNETQREALEFLKTHQATHLLLTPAQLYQLELTSTLASDENFDRLCNLMWIPLKESASKDETHLQVHFAADKPIPIKSKLEFGGKSYPHNTWSIRELFVELEKREDGSAQLQTVSVVAEMNRKTVKLPPSKVYYNEKSSTTQEESFPGTILLSSEESKSCCGSKTLWEALYISPVTEKFLLVQLYLLGQNAETFHLIYPTGEDTQASVGSPVKIWEIKYPESIQANPEDLETEFPNPDLYRLTPSQMVAEKE